VINSECSSKKGRAANLGKGGTIIGVDLTVSLCKEPENGFSPRQFWVAVQEGQQSPPDQLVNRMTIVIVVCQHDDSLALCRHVYLGRDTLRRPDKNGSCPLCRRHHLPQLHFQGKEQRRGHLPKSPLSVSTSTRVSSMAAMLSDQTGGRSTAAWPPGLSPVYNTIVRSWADTPDGLCSHQARMPDT
jgi:hypothetical protein